MTVESNELCQKMADRAKLIAVDASASFTEVCELPIEFVPADATMLDPGRQPDDIPRQGVLIAHQATISESGESSPLAWFIAEQFSSLLEANSIPELAKASSKGLASEMIKLSASRSSTSLETWADFLAGELPVEMIWQKFVVSVAGTVECLAYLAIPTKVALAYVDLTPVAASASPLAPEPQPPSPSMSPASTETLAQPNDPRAGLSAKAHRVLRTQVPVIVTLAHKKELAAKVLQYGPGSIIEFEQSCDSPLEIRANNLPIGLGEAVKIGEHFGLRIVSVVSPEERIERMGY